MFYILTFRNRFN